MSKKSPENRDAAAIVVRQLGVTDDRGPRAFVSIKPTKLADALAIVLAARALEALRQLPDGEPRIAIQMWRPSHKPRTVEVASVHWSRSDVPRSPDPVACALGLPLSLSIAESLVPGALETIIRRLAPSLNPERATAIHLGPRPLMAEAHLWDIANKYSGRACGFTAPYASRIRALRWWWEPIPSTPQSDADLQTAGRVQELVCVRCGWIFGRHNRASGDALLPFCTHCVKRKPRGITRTASLEHARAIAPAGRGKWWLPCSTPGCSAVFEGATQARRCPAHRLNRITPARRS